MNLHDHVNQSDESDASTPEAVKASRLGLVLFGIYTLIYAGFLALNTFAPDVVAMTPIPGVNLAIIYGFGLIVAALVMAMFYGWACRQRGPIKSETS